MYLYTHAVDAGPGAAQKDTAGQPNTSNAEQAPSARQLNNGLVDDAYTEGTYV